MLAEFFLTKTRSRCQSAAAAEDEDEELPAATLATTTTTTTNNNNITSSSAPAPAPASILIHQHQHVHRPAAPPRHVSEPFSLPSASASASASASSRPHSRAGSESLPPARVVAAPTAAAAAAVPLDRHTTLPHPQPPRRFFRASSSSASEHHTPARHPNKSASSLIAPAPHPPPAPDQHQHQHQPTHEELHVDLGLSLGIRQHASTRIRTSAFLRKRKPAPALDPALELELELELEAQPNSSHRFPLGPSAITQAHAPTPNAASASTATTTTTPSSDRHRPAHIHIHTDTLLPYLRATPSSTPSPGPSPLDFATAAASSSSSSSQAQPDSTSSASSAHFAKRPPLEPSLPTTMSVVDPWLKDKLPQQSPPLLPPLFTGSPVPSCPSPQAPQASQTSHSRSLSTAMSARIAGPGPLLRPQHNSGPGSAPAPAPMHSRHASLGNGSLSSAGGPASTDLAFATGPATPLSNPLLGVLHQPPQPPKLVTNPLLLAVQDAGSEQDSASPSPLHSGSTRTGSASSALVPGGHDEDQEHLSEISNASSRTHSRSPRYSSIHGSSNGDSPSRPPSAQGHTPQAAWAWVGQTASPAESGTSASTLGSPLTAVLDSVVLSETAAPPDRCDPVSAPLRNTPRLSGLASLAPSVPLGAPFGPRDGTGLGSVSPAERPMQLPRGEYAGNPLLVGLAASPLEDAPPWPEGGEVSQSARFPTLPTFLPLPVGSKQCAASTKSSAHGPWEDDEELRSAVEAASAYIVGGHPPSTEAGGSPRAGAFSSSSRANSNSNSNSTGTGTGTGLKTPSPRSPAPLPAPTLALPTPPHQADAAGLLPKPAPPASSDFGEESGDKAGPPPLPLPMGVLGTGPGGKGRRLPQVPVV